LCAACDPTDGLGAMDGFEKATSGDGSASGSRGNTRPGRVYPHLEDLVVKANVQLDIHTPVRSLSGTQWAESIEQGANTTSKSRSEESSSRPTTASSKQT
jgi:hypothetical protein